MKNVYISIIRGGLNFAEMYYCCEEKYLSYYKKMVEYLKNQLN